MDVKYILHFSFPQFPFVFEIAEEVIPFLGSLLTVCLYDFIIDELRGIAVVEIVTTIELNGVICLSVA